MDRSERDPWSVTREDLFDAMGRYRATESPAVVATVVDVEGSAYRRPGAKMLIDPGAESLGAITAGCLEGPVRDLAAEVFEDGSPSVHTFDLVDDDGWGLGLGCNGVIDVLLEPLDHRWDGPLSELDARRSVGTITAVEATDPSIGVGDRAVVGEDGGSIDGANDPGLPDAVVDAVSEQLLELRASDGSATVEVEAAGGRATVFLDWLAPAPDLLLFGSQNDVHPVARIGREAGFRVVVASARGARSDPEQFPGAHAVRSVHPAEVAEAVEVPERTYAVVMSHNALEDRLALASLLDAGVPYVGLMGPRERFADIREELEAEEGRTLTAEELGRIATPVGLDLGGGEPTQIALSVVAEALAVHNGRDGGRLAARKDPIHDRVTPAE